eukprot:gene1113-1216_t
MTSSPHRDRKFGEKLIEAWKESRDHSAHTTVQIHDWSGHTKEAVSSPCRPEAKATESAGEKVEDWDESKEHEGGRDSTWREVWSMSQLRPAERVVVALFAVLCLFVTCNCSSLLDFMESSAARVVAWAKEIAVLDSQTVDWERLVSATALGGLLAFALDYRPSQTDSFLWDCYCRARMAATRVLLVFNSVLQQLAALPLLLRYLLAVAAIVASGVFLVRRIVLTVVGVGHYLMLLLRNVVLVSAFCALTYQLLARSYYARKRKQQAVQAVQRLTRRLLSEHDRPYPVSYLYHDIEDCLEKAEAGCPEQPVCARVLSAINILGDTLPRQASASRPDTLEDSLHGVKLSHIWGEVTKEMKQDKRIQCVEMIFDGRKQACWRLLARSRSPPPAAAAPSTTASIPQ